MTVHRLTCDLIPLISQHTSQPGSGIRFLPRLAAVRIYLTDLIYRLL
ncbi:MAG: hypothetical protein ACO35C_07740 [Pontimonas sp.]